jgi:uncharacterized membrane protein YccC
MLTWPTHRALLSALSGYLAVILALFVAFALDLPNPWWAMATVYLAQPPRALVGAIWAKAFYRVAGTIIGMIASIVLIPNLANSPELMILALAGWIGLCVFVGVLDRTPRSYTFMLAGYTVALIGLPAAAHPEGIFDVAATRAEEIIIGVLAPALVQSLLFPQSVASVMTEKLDDVIRRTRSRISEGLRAPVPVSPPWDIAVQLTEVNLLASDWRFEGAFSRFRQRALWALEERLIALLPLVTAVEDRLAVIRRAGTPDLAGLTTRLAVWVETADEAGVEAQELVAGGIKAITPQLGPASNWTETVAASLTGHLTELVTIWQECMVLNAAIRASSGRARGPAGHLIAGARPRALHVDRGIAFLSAVVSALTVVWVAAFSIAIQWESAAFAVGTAALCCSLFAAADDPTPLVKDMVIGFLIAMPLPLFFSFVILPRIDGFVMLAVVLFPILTVLGLLLTYPKHYVKALGAAVAFSGGLGLQPSFVATLPNFMNIYLPLVLGPIFALIGLGLARALPAQHVVRRILRAGRQELAALARAEPSPTRVIWTSRMLDRVGLLLPRLSRIGVSEEGELAEALRDLRLGMSVVELQRLSGSVDSETRRNVDTMLAELAKHFDELSRGKAVPIPTSIVARLDAAMTGILRLSDSADRRAGVSAVMSFRRTLFPQAPAYDGSRVTI